MYRGRGFVVQDRKVGDVAYFLGQFLDLEFEESPLTRAVPDDSNQAEQLRRAVFKAFLEADARSVPMVLVSARHTAERILREEGGEGRSA